MGAGAVFVASMIAAIFAMCLSIIGASFGPLPGAIPAAGACVIVSLVGTTVGFALKKLEDRVKALEARRESPDQPK